jgi:arabinose-5-phosphate isomerase
LAHLNNRAAWIPPAIAALELEAEAIRAAASRVDISLPRAVELILEQDNKVVVTGIGKSGHVAQKLAGTLCSTGTPAVFLHPVEALHGDLGVYAPGDPTIVISRSGTTAELLRLVPVLHERHSPVIGILGVVASPLARLCDVVLDASVRCEADPHNLTPTASSIVAMALGDAISIALMEARGFRPEDFARIHPGGQLGANLRLHVRDAAHGGEDVAWVRRADAIRDVVIAMTRRPLGAACVISDDGRLEGIITDGDLRRALEAHDDIRVLKAADIMTSGPITVSPDARLHEALRLMEDRKSQISVLPVVESDGRCSGLIRIHDIYQPR